MPDKNQSFDSNSVQKSTVYEDVEYEELKIFIIKNLDESYVEIYNACINDEAVTPYYKNKLLIKISEIMKEWNRE